MGNLEVISNIKAELGEGPVWDARSGAVYWVDIEGKRFFSHNPSSGQLEEHDAGQRIGAVVPREQGGFIAALENGIFTYDPASREWIEWSDTERDLTGNRFNDGKCDAAGRLLAGTMSTIGEPKAGALYRFDLDGRVDRLEEGVSTSNGLAWSLDNQFLYYIDSNTQTVAAFDYDLESGTVSGKRTVIEIPKEAGTPDGMSIDAEGMLWIAHWGGFKVARFNPQTGELLQEIRLPAPLVTSCAFGGEHLDELYITTARVGLSQEKLEQYPLSGSLFKVKLAVKGTLSIPFKG
ncbi:SMP-30/gluconolactonase/LRE family protein [Paenibacillus sp. MAHUQ-46]|uniref:SMP-30/gluconolactonase/LRE family protein n=1 Tax=Paenibacillus roseus TaxID=2798579 RepID=A0A934MX11_9BACL|nr:SMP-30/gluconolactonase/LRE family protein [Paenibacillus roseus]